MRAINVDFRINKNYLKIYKNNKFIPLHEPRFLGNEKKYLNVFEELTKGLN